MQGPVLGRYRLLGRIAQGGMGEVWRGVDVGYGGIERPIALKRITPALASDPTLRQQFLDEAKVGFLLCHQNVVQVRDIGEADGDLYIAMEWVEGADLGTIMKRLHESAGQPLPLRFAILLAVEAARGLDYAHRLRDASGRWLQLVHRDVSPSNLLCSFEGEIKVSDFGIARSRLKEQTSIPGALKGKIGYMAPEQARGEIVDARADQFALGAALYEMLTAQNPFFHEAASEKEAIERVRNARFRPLRQVLPTVPQGLEAIVLRAMAARREERYDSVAQLREDLESFARREAYALSPSDFGQFLRDLLAESTEQAAAQATGEARPATPVKRVSGSRAVTPRAFNDALGGALAALGASDDGDGEEEAAPVAALSQPTSPGRRAARPRTAVLASPVVVHAPVGAHAAVPLPAVSDTIPDEPAPPSADMTDLVPRTRPALPLVVGGVAACLVIGGAIWLARRPTANAATVNAATANAATANAATANAATANTATANGPRLTSAGHGAAANPSGAPSANGAAPAAHVVAAPAAERDHHKARAAARAAEAHLSITSDVAADAFVDGQYVRATPIVDLSLAPGKHLVRLESTAPGLRLIPKEQTVELRAGELRDLKMELK